MTDKVSEDNRPVANHGWIGIHRSPLGDISAGFRVYESEAEVYASVAAGSLLTVARVEWPKDPRPDRRASCSVFEPWPAVTVGEGARNG